MGNLWSRKNQQPRVTMSTLNSCLIVYICKLKIVTAHMEAFVLEAGVFLMALVYHTIPTIVGCNAAASTR